MSTRKIGIIGAENSHATAIAKIINIDKAVKDFSVDYIWGEKEEFAKKAAEAGNIPNIVNNPKAMLGKIDAVIIDHRHPKYHLEAALPFIKYGIPTFIDKPFCYRSDKGVEFFKIAKKHGTPVTSFSVLSLQQSFKKFLEKLKDAGKLYGGITYGPCSLKSKYGGIFFYGIHQVDMVLKSFGYDVNKVLVTKNGDNATGQLFYSDAKIVTMNLISVGCDAFGITAIGEKKIIAQSVVFDKNMYLTGVKKFTEMFKTGKEPEQYDHILKPVQVLGALQKSINSGKVEKV